MTHLVGVTELTVLIYFVGLHAGYLALDVSALAAILRSVHARNTDALPRRYGRLEPPVSILVPAYNESATIEATVRALLQLSYPEFEVVVISDGSTDATVEVLDQAFDLHPVEQTARSELATGPVRATYVSARSPALRVVDKDNGGKADALNAGINASRYPLYCAVDADSILQADSLRRAVRPFLDDPSVVASGGTVRIANGCEVHGGYLTDRDVPRNPLALIQVVEYLRAFLFGRMGWVPINALLVVSGAFGVFDRAAVVAVGGYRVGTIGEDMELVVRLHRHLTKAGTPYRITFVPDPICWTEAPEDLRSLGRQRMRWQRGLAESLWHNRRLLFARHSGATGWLAFPFQLLFECFGPFIEVAGFAVLAAGAAAGVLSWSAFAAFLALAFSLGLLLSLSALLLEELSFHVYPKARHVALLALAGVAENLGYRQLVSFWRICGLVQWATRRQATWGSIERRAQWATPISRVGHD